MRTVKLSALLLLGIIMTCQKISAQTYSTDFDGNTGSTMTINPSSGSNGSIVAPSNSTIVNHNYVTPAQTTTTTTSTSSPSVSTMVGGMIMQSMINNLFSSPKPDPAAEAAAKAAAEAKAKAEAAAAAAAKAKAEAEAAAKLQKYLDSRQPLPYSTNADLVPLTLPTNTSNNFFGTGNQGVNLNDDAFSELNAIESVQLNPVESSQSELFTVHESSTIDYYNPEEPPANSSPKESIVKDVVFYAQSVEDAALSSYKDGLKATIKSETYPELGTISKLIKLEKIAKYSSVLGAGIGIYSYYDDLSTIYKDKNLGFNSKSLYEVSTAVADAGLMVAGIGTLVGAAVVSTPLALTAGTVMLLGKIYITQNPEIYKKDKW